MKGEIKVKNLFLIIIFSVLLFSSVYSASMQAPSIGARATGMAGAFVAVSDDPSSLYNNPAGLGMLEGTSFMKGTTLIDPTAYYDIDGADREKSITPVQMISNVFITHNFNDSVSIGLGYYSPFGLGQIWEDDAALRGNSVRSEISLSNLQGGLSYRVADNVLVGAGLAQGFAKMHTKSFTAVWPTGMPAPSEASAKMWGEASGINGNIGILWAPSENWTVGGTWRSETNVKFEGEVDFSPQAYPKFDEDLTVDYTFPQTVSMGVSYSGFDRWLLSGQVDWVDWSRIDTITQKLDNPVTLFNTITNTVTVTDEIEISRDWKDRYILRLGAEYEVNPNFVLRGGYMWDPSPVPEETLDPLMFDVSNNRYSVGASFQIWKVYVDAAYMYTKGIRREAEDSENALPTDGDYWGHSHVFELSTTYTF
jgi:long-chain fatty acid transport protein